MNLSQRTRPPTHEKCDREKLKAGLPKAHATTIHDILILILLSYSQFVDYSELVLHLCPSAFRLSKRNKRAMGMILNMELNQNERSMSMSVGVTAIGVLVSWLWLYRWRQRHKVGPKTWPFLGAAAEQLLNYDHMHDWILAYLSKCSTISVPMPFSHYTYTVNPTNVEYVLKSNFSNYPKGESYRYYMEVLLGDGIFNADGEMWRKQRKTASFEFASKNLRDFSTVVFREYALKLAHILSRVSLYQQSLDMQDLFMRMTLDSICKVGFGVEIGTLSLQLPENPFARAFDTANIVVTLRFIDPLWRIKRFLRIGTEALLNQSIQKVDNFTYSVIRKRKAEIEQAKANGNRAQVI